MPTKVVADVASGWPSTALFIGWEFQVNERPYVSFPEVKERVSIPDALDKLGLLDQFARKGETLTGVCPLPEHQHGPRPNARQFKVNRRDGLWLFHCFGDCGRGGDVIELVKSITGHDDAHVRFWFADNFGDRLSAKKPTRSRSSAEDSEPGTDRQETKQAHDNAGWTSTKPQAPKATVNLPGSVSPLKPLRFKLQLDPTAPYLRERGVSEEIIKRYGLGLCNRGYFNGYVAAPIVPYPRSSTGRPVGYIGRWPGEDFDDADGRPRYKLPAGFESGRVVYGLAEAMDAEGETPLIVVEGPFKVFHLAHAGFPTVVSTLTSGMTDDQARILVATGRPIVLLFDGNQAGYEGMRRAAARLITQAFVRVVKLAEGVEPDHLSPADLQNHLSFL